MRSYYENAGESLGVRFKNEVDRCVLRIVKHPKRYPVLAVDCRTGQPSGLSILHSYIVRDDTLWILAIAHARRKPLFWVSRRNQVL